VLVNVIGHLVDGVIEVKPTDAGPVALMKKLPVTPPLNVVTTKTYALPDCRLRLILNCRLSPLSSSYVIKL
jgi:hypothetical protein